MVVVVTTNILDAMEKNSTVIKMFEWNPESCFFLFFFKSLNSNIFNFANGSVAVFLTTLSNHNESFPQSSFDCYANLIQSNIQNLAVGYTIVQRFGVGKIF